jgi:hypothetical protein
MVYKARSVGTCGISTMAARVFVEIASPRLIVFLKTQLLRRTLTSPILDGEVVMSGMPGTCDIIGCLFEGLGDFDIIILFVLNVVDVFRDVHQNS